MNKYDHLTTQAVCVDDNNTIWIFANTFNALFKMDSEKGDIQYVTSFFKEPFLMESLYTKAVYYKNRIFFIPCCAESIAVFDIISETTDYIFLEKNILDYNVICYSEGKLLLFPVKNNNWGWKLDMETCRVSRMVLDFKDDEKLLKTKSVVCFYGNAFYDGKSYFAVYGTNKCMTYNIENNQCTMISIEKNGVYAGAFQIGKEIHFLSIDGSYACCYKPQLNKWGKIIPFPCRGKKYSRSYNGEKAYYELLDVGNNTSICIPIDGNDLLWYKDGKQIRSERIKWEKALLDKGALQAYAVLVCIVGKTHLFPYKCLARMEIDDSSVSYYEMNIEKKEFLRIAKEYRNNTSIFCDKEVMAETVMPLDLYLESI